MIVSLQRPPTASVSYSAFCIEDAPESCTPDKSALPLYLSLEAPDSLPVARSVIVMKASDEPLRYISSVFVVKSGIVASDADGKTPGIFLLSPDASSQAGMKV